MSLEVGLLVFPHVQQLDLTGPYEVFASLPDTRVHLIWKEIVPITSATGLILTPTMTFADCPALDVICVPGGSGVNALLGDGDVLDFVRSHAASARYVTSVCTGSLVLGAAGLLKGRRATSHWNAIDFLPAFGAEPVHARVVEDGNLMTAGGVTSGIDFGLTIAARIAGQETAEVIQLSLEYAPAPPFDAGLPDTAKPQITALARAGMTASRQAREAFIHKLRAEQ